MTFQEKIDKCCDALKPEAQEIVNACMSAKIKTTKDNYGKLAGFISSIKDKATQTILLEACIRQGYPLNTGHQVAQILGLKTLS
jgi:hypothetical protein|tara:strand:+ start:443 stop:694 length:252 start_codon:yes stop_codon:yes gene_type:complete